MAVKLDIFAPQISKVASGLEGKTIFIYGGNGVGKTYTAAHMSKPFFIACESGLNAIAGVAYNRVTKWSEFKTLIKQLTDKATVEKARAMYDTIVIDEIYAASVFCQDYITNTYGDGALTLGDMIGKRNGYALYEKTFFQAINQLLSADYTVVFIGHAQEKDNFIFPKGDKRCLGPIIDNSDFVIYAASNGVDDKGNVIFSTGYLTQTANFFARTRFTECVPSITPLSAKNLEQAINDAIAKEAEKSGIAAVSYDEQKNQNAAEELDFDMLMSKTQELCVKFAEANKADRAVEIIENTLGVGEKISNCTKKQVEALSIIYNDLVAELPTL